MGAGADEAIARLYMMWGCGGLRLCDQFVLVRCSQLLAQNA